MLHRCLQPLHEGPRFGGAIFEEEAVGISIDTNRCESTGVCEMVCPEAVIEIGNGVPVIVNNMACTSCWKCAESCVSNAIDVD